MTSLRWIARGVFLVALVVWGRMAIRAMDRPEMGRQTREGTAAFAVMMGAGMASFPRPKPAPRDEEETL